MTPEQWTPEKVQAEISKMMAETVKLGAETAKLGAETEKVKRESWWYPLVVITAMVAAIVGLSKLIG